MPSCERCWADAYGDPYKNHQEEYHRLLKERVGSLTCTPEERAGPDATECAVCETYTVHQHCHICVICDWEE